MIPQPITLDGRSGTVVYLDAQWHPVTPEQATMAKVVFDDGGTAFYFTEDDARKREYVREPAGSPKGGEFAKTGALSQASSQASFDPAKKETWYRTGGDWHRSPEGEKPYHWKMAAPDYEPPKRVHQLIRGRGIGIWGGSHYGSKVMTGEAAKQMGIEGYKDLEATTEAATLTTRMLQAIADDTGGSEEPLYHSFENTRQTVFTPGDTLSLPLTATAGEPVDYGHRLEMESQQGAPTFFVFPKGTPMVGYGTTQEKDLDDIGQPTVEAQYKEQGFIWDEAIVAGKFRVVKTEVRYMGSQHLSRPMLEGETPQLYGQVVYLEPVSMFDPATKKWVPRG